MPNLGLGTFVARKIRQTWLCLDRYWQSLPTHSYFSHFLLPLGPTNCSLAVISSVGYVRQQCGVGPSLLIRSIAVAPSPQSDLDVLKIGLVMTAKHGACRDLFLALLISCSIPTSVVWPSFVSPVVRCASQPRGTRKPLLPGGRCKRHPSCGPRIEPFLSFHLRRPRD